MTRFFRIVLRTLDVDAARAFYAAVLGAEPLHLFPLHEQAIARGARPHWLGMLSVADVDKAVEAFVARGSTLLGPKWVNPEGVEAATLRDPGGAMLALARAPAHLLADEVQIDRGHTKLAWSVLNTHDVEQAKRNYRELLGWEFHEPFTLAGSGTFHPFAYEPGAAPVGSMSDVKDRLGVHAHWIFQFGVPALESALAAVRSGGGKVIGPLTLPGGDTIAVCDDPQGGAFSLRQRA
jgi:predicted enzyme related to lactoylglutathione lyase